MIPRSISSLLLRLMSPPSMAFSAYFSSALFLLSIRSLNLRKSSHNRSWLNSFFYLDWNPLSRSSTSLSSSRPTSVIIPSKRVPTNALNSLVTWNVHCGWRCIRTCFLLLSQIWCTSGLRSQECWLATRGYSEIEPRTHTSNSRLAVNYIFWLLLLPRLLGFLFLFLLLRLGFFLFLAEKPLKHNQILFMLAS